MTLTAAKMSSNSSSSNTDSIFNRLQLFGGGHQQRSSSDEDSDPETRTRPTRPQRIDPATSSVKRCLFGRGNTEENIKFAKREMEKSLAESKKKWNFDFENERPMEGRFEWQSSPYPKIQLRSKRPEDKQENVENLKPSSLPPGSASSNPPTTSNPYSIQHTSSSSTSSSSDERICDRDQTTQTDLETSSYQRRNV